MAALLVLMLPGDALAQTAPLNNHLDAIVRVYRDHARGWTRVLTTYAVRLFWLLAGVEFTFAAFGLAFKGADLGEWASTIVNQILFIGFFYTLLTHSAEWSGAIVESFRTAANGATAAAGGTAGVSPSNVFETGVSLAARLMSKASFLHPGDSLGFLISALVVVICFALIAASLVVALVEMYVVTSAGVLFMGFGGSRFTKEIALRMLVYAVSVGAKLFVISLVVGLGESMIMGFLTQFGTSDVDLFLMVGAAIVFLALVHAIPQLVQSLVAGTSLAGGAGVMLSAGAGVAAGAGAVIAGGASMGLAARGAYQLAKEQLASATTAGSAPPAGMGRVGRMAGLMAGNLGRAALADVGNRLGGRPGAHHGNAFGRMGLAMSDEAKLLENRNKKPAPAGGSSAPQPGTKPPNA
ncbi:P-type conjugative transfer protein TrbL [Anaeromyxobacter diazotrophicus]|uniref:Conjugal transfer protein TrbL n=1 Tax=Anaeromyxobacter diazotrophicus TaxID=2590199 RepID=A0A7I9VJU7_9BACT|nr:P-type conjugative transfer protein TrbL [Anaeromyxobacter diazotrophicus]GEJ56653.1 conjugal transfer protein TrbL [Anaeromyxobacter diazotrophicus]